MRDPLTQAAECTQAPESTASDDDQVGGLGGGVEEFERLGVVRFAIGRNPPHGVEIDAGIRVATTARR